MTSLMAAIRFSRHHDDLLTLTLTRPKCLATEAVAAFLIEQQTSPSTGDSCDNA